MPGQRADGVGMRGIPLHKDLWDAAKEKAARDGVSRVEAIRRLMQSYVDGRITLPPP